MDMSIYDDKNVTNTILNIETKLEIFKKSKNGKNIIELIKKI